jgi:hypothetical protein
MIHESAIDREAVAEAWRAQFDETGRRHIEAGLLTPAEATALVDALMSSEMVQGLIDDNLAHLQAHFAGRVH